MKNCKPSKLSNKQALLNLQNRVTVIRSLKY